MYWQVLLTFGEFKLTSVVSVYHKVSGLIVKCIEVHCFNMA